MIFESLNPLWSRRQFQLRSAINMAVIWGMFVVAVAAMSVLCSILFPGTFVPMLAGDAIALGGAYCLYAIWDKRPIRMRCEECEAIILSNTPWVCGVCKHDNRNATEFPFVRKCGNPDCEVEPKAYRCHHCGKLVFLSDDRDATNYAYSINSPAEVSEPDKHAEELRKLREKREKKAEQLEVARVEKDLVAMLKELKSQKQKEKTMMEILEADVDAVMELEAAESKLQARYEQEYESDRATLSRLKKALKNRVRLRKGEGN